MKIDAIQVYRVAMPLVYPFRTSFGDEDCIESVLVRMSSGGAHGWGEATPWRSPAYSSEWAAGAFLLVRDWLAPLLVGREVGSGEALQGLLARFRGNPFAKASLDLAWWDLHARMAGVPLWRALGGRGPTIDVGADLGVMESLDGLLAEVQRVEEEGFKRLKLKYRPGWEVEMVAAVRRAHPEMVIHVDCNSAYALDDLPMLQELDRYDLAMIEQPLAHDDLVDHATLQRAIATPICLDESITSPAAARKAIQLGACRWVNVKPGRVGGLTPAVAIHDLCQGAGIPCWVGGMLESAVGQAHNLALATLANFAYPADIFPSSRFYARDLGEPEMTLCAPSRMRAQPGPGIGCAPDAQRLADRQIESVVID